MTGNILLFLVIVWPMAGALAAWIIGRKTKTGRDLFADGVTAAELILLAVLFAGGIGGRDGFTETAFSWPGFGGLGLTLKLDGFRILYGLIAAFMWFMTTVFSREYFKSYRNRNRYYLFMLMTLGAVMGVFLSDDLYTTFLFFEIMSFTSYTWVAHEEKEAAMKAAGTYLAVAVLGGLVMLMGILLLYHLAGTLSFGKLLSACEALPAERRGTLYLAGGLMAFGFGAKAGMFPLHIWLPKAHPVAPAPASALLSGMLTKTGIFGILVVTANLFRHDPVWGTCMFLLGLATMFGGALLAVFSVDLKRTLACSSMSQIGFILVGVGMQGLLGEENALAVRGTILHMVNHSMIKLVLFMAAGVIYMNLHRLDLNEIRGFGRKKPLLAFCFLTGALSIGGIPLFGGYVSKTLLHESIVEYIHGTVLGPAAFWKASEWIFLLSGGMTVAYMTKLFVAVFVEKNAVRQKQFDEMTRYWNEESRAAVTVSALLLLPMGLFPGAVMDKLADLGQAFLHGESPAHPVRYFSVGNLKGSMISIAIGVVIYFGFIRTVLMERDETGRKVYVDRWPAWLDLEQLLYRPVLLRFLPWLFGGICRILDEYLLGPAVRGFMAVTGFFCRLLDQLADSVILLARKTTHRQTGIHREKPIGDHLAYSLGHFLDGCIHIANGTFLRKHPIQKSYVRGLVEFEEETIRTNRIITGSLSFALLLVCVGLLFVLIYLLFV